MKYRHFINYTCLWVFVFYVFFLSFPWFFSALIIYSPLLPPKKALKAAATNGNAEAAKKAQIEEVRNDLFCSLLFCGVKYCLLVCVYCTKNIQCKVLTARENILS